MSGLLSKMLHVRRVSGLIAYRCSLYWRLRVCVGIVRVVILMDQGWPVVPDESYQNYQCLGSRLLGLTSK